jgi:hypothetical protein
MSPPVDWQPKPPPSTIHPVCSLFGWQTPAAHVASAPQSVSLEHMALLQAVAPHVFVPHSAVCGATQAPAPVQVLACVSTPLAQEAATHCTVASGKVHESRFVPSHVPPHSEPSVAQATRSPCGAPVTGAQVPTLPATSHASHWPSHAVLQHTPSTQLPPPHWLSLLHEPPKFCFGTHTPAEHQLPDAQSESAAQSPLHAATPQANWPHDCSCAPGQ